MTRGMGQAQNQVRHTYEVSADLTGEEYKLVELDGSDQLQLVGTEGNFGVVMEDPKDTAGQEATVIIWGKAAVEAGASLSPFDPITPNASGQAIVADATGDDVIGVALESGDSGDLVTVFVTAAHADIN